MMQPEVYDSGIYDKLDLALVSLLHLWLFTVAVTVVVPVGLSVSVVVSVALPVA